MINLERKQTEYPQISFQHKQTKETVLEINVYEVGTKKEIIKYYKRCVLYPTISIWIDDIDTYFFKYDQG